MNNIRTVTNSELQSFKSCRREWYLSYHLRLSPRVEKQTGPLHLGTRVHEALAAYYQGEDALVAYEIFALRDLAKFPEDALEEDLSKFQSERNLGQIMIEGYLDWLAETGADAGLTVHSVEAKVQAPLFEHKGTDVHLLGKLDSRVTREIDGARLFLDHKTCANFTDVLSTILINEQFLTYQLLERLDYAQAGNTEARSQGSLVNMLRKTKRTARAVPPFYRREEVYHNEAELDVFQQRLIATVLDILRVEKQLEDGLDARTVCYPRPSRDCSWKCKFLKVCGMMEDGSDYTRMLQEQYIIYDPLARYAEDEINQEGN